MVSVINVISQVLSPPCLSLVTALSGAKCMQCVAALRSKSRKMHIFSRTLKVLQNS